MPISSQGQRQLYPLPMESFDCTPGYREPVVLVGFYLAAGLGCAVAMAWFKAFERMTYSMARVFQEFLGVHESSVERLTVSSVARHMQGRMLDDCVEQLRSQARRSTRLVWLISAALCLGPALVLFWYGRT